MPALTANVKRNSLCGIFAILLGVEDVPFKSVRQLGVVKLSTYMSVKHYCNNNADLRDCGDSHSDSCNKELQINYTDVKLLMTEMALKLLQFHKWSCSKK